MTWIEQEAERYDTLYRGGYPAGDPMRVVRNLNIPKESSVIDLGCGRATLADYFTGLYVGIDVSPYIIEENCKGRRNDEIFMVGSISDLYEFVHFHVNWALCLDVMEHIPPDHVDNCLKEIATLQVENFAFLISTRKSYILGPSGENLHPTVMSADDWKERIGERFNIKRWFKPANDSVIFHCK